MTLFLHGMIFLVSEATFTCFSVSFAKLDISLLYAPILMNFTYNTFFVLTLFSTYYTILFIPIPFMLISQTRLSIEQSKLPLVKRPTNIFFSMIAPRMLQEHVRWGGTLSIFKILNRFKQNCSLEGFSL